MWFGQSAVHRSRNHFSGWRVLCSNCTLQTQLAIVDVVSFVLFFFFAVVIGALIPHRHQHQPVPIQSANGALFKFCARKKISNVILKYIRKTQTVAHVRTIWTLNQTTMTTKKISEELCRPKIFIYIYILLLRTYRRLAVAWNPYDAKRSRQQSLFLSLSLSTLKWRPNRGSAPAWVNVYWSLVEEFFFFLVLCFATKNETTTE